MRVANILLIVIAAIIGLVFLFYGISYWYGVSQTEAEIHLIPADYRGPVVILFHRFEGQPPKYENGARVYEIPKDGLLRTQFSPQKEGWFPAGKIKYYYVYANGRRVQLSEVQRKDQMTDTTKTYIFMGSGYGKVSKNNGQRQIFQDYMVGKISDNEQEFAYKMHEMVDSW